MNSITPHHVISRLGGRVVADYWTTNRYQVVNDYDYDSGIMVRKTNRLW